MPRSVKSKTVFLVSKQDESGIQPLGVLTSFRAAFSWSLFKGGISDPVLAERAALAKLRKDLAVQVWDKTKFETRESAMWGHGALSFWIQEIPVIRN